MLTKFFGQRKPSRPTLIKTRPLHLEPLEERQMLSVSAAEFNQIPALYTSQNLADYENYSRNEAANLTGESLQGAMAHL